MITIIFYAVVIFIIAASLFIFLFKTEAGIIDAYFNAKYSDILNEAAKLAANSPDSNTEKWELAVKNARH